MEQKRLQYSNSNSSSDSFIDEEMLIRVEIAAEKEREQNRNDYTKMLGNIVQVN